MSLDREQLTTKTFSFLMKIFSILILKIEFANFKFQMNFREKNVKFKFIAFEGLLILHLLDYPLTSESNEICHKRKWFNYLQSVMANRCTATL